MKLEIEFRSKVKQMKAYTYALTLIEWDSNTEAPRNAFKRRAEMAGVLSKELFALKTSKAYQEVVNQLYAQRDQLDDLLKREVKKAKKDLDKVINIPEEEFVAYHQLLTESQLVWEDAMKENDYASFKPKLEKIIDYTRKFALYYDPNTDPYDTLLDEFEEGMTTKEYDEFFSVLKRDLVPFVKEMIQTSTDDYRELRLNHFSEAGQKAFTEYLMDELKFNRNSGLVKQSVHPFTWNTSPEDVRFTTKYLEDYVFSSIYSTVHELGHATYEQQIDTRFDDTLLSGGVSMGIHESQSRFFENHIGRSEAFWETHFETFSTIFPKQSKGYIPRDFYKACNFVEASLIRIEADELTYPIHIMLRYDIERMLFNGDITVDELPRVWNDLIEEYLGVRPENDREGVLQDVHWSGGMFGYFPTYALGSAYAAQIDTAMRREVDVDALIKERRFGEINQWLEEKIHRFGASKTPKELLINATNESFNPTYYVNYLKNKFSKIKN